VTIVLISYQLNATSSAYTSPAENVGGSGTEAMQMPGPLRDEALIESLHARARF